MFPCGVVDYSLISIARISDRMLQRLYAVSIPKTEQLLSTHETLQCHLFGNLKPEKKILLCFGLNLFRLSYLSGVEDHLLSGYF